MIRTETVCVCDICGYRTRARAIGSSRNETIYAMPGDWRAGENRDVHFCPTCVKRLGLPDSGKGRGESNA